MNDRLEDLGYFCKSHPSKSTLALHQKSAWLIWRILNIASMSLAVYCGEIWATPLSFRKWYAEPRTRQKLSTRLGCQFVGAFLSFDFYGRHHDLSWQQNMGNRPTIELPGVGRACGLTEMSTVECHVAVQSPPRKRTVVTSP